MSSDHEVQRDYVNVFHDIALLGNTICNRLVSWNNLYNVCCEQGGNVRGGKNRFFRPMIFFFNR